MKKSDKAEDKKMISGAIKKFAAKDKKEDKKMVRAAVRKGK